MPLPHHIFISYSHKDVEFVDQLADELRQHGFDIWMDHQIRPGTPNYEKAIREAITDAYALLLIATPNSRDSNYVQSEVAFAQNLKCPIYPIWAVGDNWQDSVWIEMVKTQYMDFRGANYGSSVKKLCEVLHSEINRVHPPHFPIELSYSVRLSENSRQFHPTGYFRLFISQENCVAVRCDAYKTVGEMSDDIYMSYLQDRYPPYTYGSKWIYTKLSRNKPLLVAAPLKYLSFLTGLEPLSKRDPTWRETSLPEYGFVPNSDWTIIDDPVKSLAIFGMLVNSVSVVDELQGNSGYPEKMQHGLARAIVTTVANRDATLTVFGTTFRLTKMSEAKQDQYKRLFLLAIDKKSGYGMSKSELQSLEGCLIAEIM